MRYLDQLFDRGRFREADDVEIRSVDAQNRCCSTLYYSCVISTACPIRRAHFAQLRAALLDHIGNAERTADLHQLTARDEHFALRVSGQSMIEAGILDGDVVVIHRQDEARDGEIVAAVLPGPAEDEATVKRLRRQDGRVMLVPENPTMEPFELLSGRVLGKVVAVLRKI